MAQKDVFGFDELEKRWQRLGKSWENEVSRVLKTTGGAMKTRIAQMTNKGPARKTKSGSQSVPGTLKKSWRLLPERYKVEGAFVYRFVRVASNAPHAHLVEMGHKLWVGGQGKGTPTLISFLGITRKVDNPSRRKGVVKGQHMSLKAKNELLDKFGGSVEKAFDKLTSEDKL